MKRLVILAALALALPACTVHNSDGTPIVVTADNAPAVVMLELQKACKYFTTAQAATAAIEAALQASEKVKSTTTTVETLAAIACGLLAPPPAATATAAATG